MLHHRKLEARAETQRLVMFLGTPRRYKGVEDLCEAVHRLRIECKKLRYLMEFFAELFPKEEGSAVLRLLRRLQTRLGEFNDALVQQRSLMNYWERKRSGSGVAGRMVAAEFCRFLPIARGNRSLEQTRAVP